MSRISTKIISILVLGVTIFLSAEAQTVSTVEPAKLNADKIGKESAASSAAKTKSLRDSVYQNTQPNQAAQNQSGYVFPTATARFRRFADNSFGLNGLIGAGIGAAIGQAANVPPDWKRSGNGLARRFGSNLGENAIQETTAYALEEALQLDSRFYKSRKKDFGSRLQNALLSNFTARTRSGKQVFNPSRIVGAYAANLISTAAWYPKRYNYQDGFRQGTQTVGLNVGFGFLREFLFK